MCAQVPAGARELFLHACMHTVTVVGQKWKTEDLSQMCERLVAAC